ncbi:YpmS family protein [Alteribacter lacisalsi]|nr:YpmS family protein [Alteribacter lacisalsi]
MFKIRNKWKAAFFSLFFIVTLFGLIIMFLFYRLFATGGYEEWETVERGDWEGTYPSFTVEASRDSLNQLIQQELDEEDPDRDYDLYIGEQFVHFDASFRIFGQQVPIELNLEPEVTEEGNIVLHEDSFNIGGISLPSTQVFGLIDSMADLPEWVKINPAESYFYLHLHEGIADGVLAEAEEVNLGENRIRFTIFITEREKNEAS